MAHGPRGRDWSTKLNKKVRRLGLRNALTNKLLQGRLTIVDDLPDFDGKTAFFADALSRRGCHMKGW